MIRVEVAEQLGRRWTKGQMDRIYFDLDKIGVLEVSRYGSGNISSAAWCDGESISNTKAARLLSTKIWMDATTGAICSKRDFRGAEEEDIAKAVCMIQALLGGEIGA